MFTEKFTTFMEKSIHLILISIILFSIFSVFLSIFIYLLFSNMFGYVFSFKELIWLLPAILIMFAIYKISGFFGNKKEIYFVSSMIIIQLIISIIMIISYDTQPNNDYAMIWDAAKKMANGEFIIDKTSYMYYFTWQIGIATFESFFIRVFGEHFVVLKIFNAFLLLVTNFLIYCMCKRKLNRQIACNAYVLSVFFIPWVLTIPQFTNHHIATLLLIISLRLIDSKKVYGYFIAGLLISLMNFLRPFGIILLIAAVCFTIYEFIKSKSFIPFICLSLLIFSYISTTAVIDKLVIRYEYSDTNISEPRIPYFKFQKGLYGYVSPVKDLEKFNWDYDNYNLAMKKELLEKIQNESLPSAFFVGRKLVFYFGLFDYQFGNTYNSDEAFYTSYPVKAFYSTGWFQYLAILILAFIGLRKYKKDIDIYMIFFIGNSLVYIFIEAFSSYRFESYIMLLSWAAIGMDVVYNNFESKKRSTIENMKKEYTL